MLNRRALKFVGGIVTALLLIAVAVYVVMQRSGAFVAAYDCVYSSPSVNRLIGPPNALFLLPFGSRVSYSGGGEGDATLTLFLEGDQGYAIAYAKVKERGGIWTVSDLEFHTRRESANVACRRD